jgi:hydrogenase/urease accessory protein HupE
MTRIAALSQSLASRFLLAAFLVIAGIDQALAHANGRSFLRIESVGTGAGVAVTWDIDAADLQLPLELDRDGDGLVAAREIVARREAIARFAIGRLELRRGGTACALAATDVTSFERDSAHWARLSLTASCPGSGPLAVATGLFFGSPGYSALLDVRTSAGSFPGALTLARPSWIEPPRPAVAATVLRFVREGASHALAGYDHIAFLLLLVLPSVLHRSRSSWSPALRVRDTLRDLLKTVTGFTLAHSVTLACAATGAIRLPEKPVEAAIAASIVVAGLLNLLPAAARWRLALAIGFGLLHGFGFANALQGTDTDGTHIAPVLAGFNLGIELAQLALVMAALPLLWLLRRVPNYASCLMPGLSVATALAGAVWLGGRL